MNLTRNFRAMKLTKNIGMLLLGIWLILSGLIPLLHLSFSALGHPHGDPRHRCGRARLAGAIGP
jgi:hypothetical protein